MDSQRFSPPGPDPGMCGGDRDLFLRVWKRVMPEEREGCPIIVENPRQKQPPAVKSGNAQMKRANDRAESDFPTVEDVPCLGSGGERDAERLQQWVMRELSSWRAYQMLAYRGGQGGRILSAMASGCRHRAKRLSAALFLISGVRFWPTEPPRVSVPRSYFGALREHFLSEQNRGGAYRAAAEDCGDACLRELYLDLADECADHTARIRALLEAM